MIDVRGTYERTCPTCGARPWQDCTKRNGEPADRRGGTTGHRHKAREVEVVGWPEEEG